MNKRKSSVNKFISYSKKDRKPQGYGRMAMALAKNIASPKDPSLFDGEEISKREERIQIEKASYRMERNGKPVFLSNKDTRLVYLLTSQLNIFDDDIQEFVKWTERVEEFGITEAGDPPRPIARNFQLRELAKALYGRSTKQYIEEIRNGLKNLLSIKQVIVLGKQQVKITASLIMHDMSIEDLSPEERGMDVERIAFGSVFLWNIKKRYAYLDKKIFEIWGKKGSGTETELFSTLLSTILNICAPHQIAAKAARKRVNKELKEKELSQEEKEAYLNGEVRNALTYKESFSYIKSRVSTDYESQRQYKSKFKADLKKAIEALKFIGIITEGYISKGKNMEEMAIFVINENYRNPKQLSAPSDNEEKETEEE